MSTFKEMSDEELALLYVNGNNKAFDELLSRIQDKIFTYIMYMVKDEDMANDLFQETFIKAITKLQNDLYTDSGKFVFWVMRIAHNVIIDHYREIKGEHIVEPTKDNDLQNLKGASVLDTYRESEMVNERDWRQHQHLTGPYALCAHQPEEVDEAASRQSESRVNEGRG